MLAHYLSAQLPHHTVTLIAFSLGCHVTKSCLNRLYKMHRYQMVHNVYFLAAATFIKESKLVRWQEVFIKAVAGRICNVYCVHDRSLHTFNYMFTERALGSTAYYSDYKLNAASECKSARKKYRFDNFDVSKFVGGHMDYQSKQDLIMEFVQFDS